MTFNLTTHGDVKRRHIFSYRFKSSVKIIQILGFIDSVLGFDDSILRFNDSILGLNDSILGFNDSILGFNDSISRIQ